MLLPRRRISGSGRRAAEIEAALEHVTTVAGRPISASVGAAVFPTTAATSPRRRERPTRRCTPPARRGWRSDWPLGTEAERGLPGVGRRHRLGPFGGVTPLTMPYPLLPWERLDDHSTAGSPGSARRSSPRCRRSPRRRARSTSVRASPTPTARPRCSTQPSPPSAAASTSTRRGPACRSCATAIAEHQRRWYGIELDPDTEVRRHRRRDRGARRRAARDARPRRRGRAVRADVRQLPGLHRAGRRRARCRCCSRPADGSYGFDPDELRAAVTARTKLILLNTPHNPTGKVFDARELTTIAELAIEHDLIVVTDEVYEHLAVRRAPARPDLHAAGDGGADADDLVGRQDVQHDRLEDRLDDRPGPLVDRGADRQAVPHLRQRRAVPAGDRRRSRPARRRTSPGSRAVCRPRAIAWSTVCVAAGLHHLRARGDLLRNGRHPAARSDGTAWLLPRAAGAMRCRRRPERGVLRRREHGRHLVRFACCKQLERDRRGGRPAGTGLA